MDLLSLGREVSQRSGQFIQVPTADEAPSDRWRPQLSLTTLTLRQHHPPPVFAYTSCYSALTVNLYSSVHQILFLL